MRRLVAAVTFLTRLRIPGEWNFDVRDIGRSAIFFPLIGAAIGYLQYGLLAGAEWLSRKAEQHSGHAHPLPVSVVAVLLVATAVLITGALHLDGLADTADGFGGGRTREDVLRIMRDHAIGAYGAVALVLVLGLKAASIYACIEQGVAVRFLVIAPALARASVVALGFLAPYARAAEGNLGNATQFMGLPEVLVSAATAITLAIWLAGWRGGVALAVAAFVSFMHARLGMKKIGGITGDLLGANIEICESLVLATGAILSA
jgi:adenosylcobinamide-GDP ribazoletransferase